MQNCPECSTSVEENANFCYQCGFNYKIEKLNTRKDDFHKKNVTSKEDMHTISEIINFFEDTEDIFNEQIERAKQFNNALKAKQSMHDRLQMQVKKSKLDLDRSNKISLSSITKKLKGDTDSSKIKKELYYNALSELYEFEEDLKEIETQLSIAKTQLDQIKSIHIMFIEYKNDINSTLQEMSTDKSSPEIDALKQHINDLEEQIKPISEMIRKLSWANSHLLKARNAYAASSADLQTASAAAAPSFFEDFNRFSKDLLINSNQSQSRRKARDGNASLNEARRLLKGIKDINLPNVSVDLKSKNLFFNNIFSDFANHKAINSTLSEINSGTIKISDQITSISLRISQLQATLEPLQRELRKKKEELILLSFS
ncbi:MAG: hypothetical protein INQ03_02890 [Candidatus Heimdallarchaeota archaeon]|nr:hypothetical protein [Candidatus Heimdallarchaeota archaeon]